jgi:hypothetical protein
MAVPQPGYGAVGYGAVGYGAVGYGATGRGPLGQVRSTGLSMLLFVVTLGFYSFYWWYLVHDEMKRHRGVGLGGGLALLTAVLVTPVTAFFTAQEVGELYTSSGRPAPVSGLSGLWYFPGNLLLVGPIVWFVQVNGALNDYWRSLGAS